MAKRSKTKSRKSKAKKKKADLPVPVSERALHYPVEDKGILYVGIDMGTSKTKVSASNGIRKIVDSIVGYPKDIIAEKFLQKSVLFGSEALKNRLSLDLFQPIARGVVASEGKTRSPTDDIMNAARELFEYAIDLSEPKPDQKIYTVICTPAEITDEERSVFIALAQDVVDGLYFVPTPFAVAYGIEELNSLIVDIGGETVDFSRVYGTIPTPSDLLTSYKAGSSIDNLLLDLVEKKAKGAQLTPEMVRKWKEEYGFVLKPKEHIDVEFPIEGVPKVETITNELKKACESIIPEIVENIGSLIASFDPEFQEEIRRRILLAGGCSQLRELARAIQTDLEAMRCVVRSVPDPLFRGADGALKFGQDLPSNAWQLFEG